MEDKEHEIELQALESIFMSDLTCSPSRDSFKLRVVPSYGGAFKNHLALQMSASFPSDYPASSLENVDLKVVEGAMLEDSLRHLKEVVMGEAQRLRGSAMVYSVIEKLKEHLQMYNEDMNEGVFILLSNEILLDIFSYLGPHDLAGLACVNKNFKNLSEDNGLWASICESEPMMKSRLRRIEASGEEPASWKQEYIRHMGLTSSEETFAALVVERKNTGDEWLTHLTHLVSWKDSFKKEMAEEHSITMTGGEIGKILLGTKVVGRYRFSDEYAEDIAWKQAYQRHMKGCPYIGNPLGCIRFSLKSSFSKILKSVMMVSRGALARHENPNDFIMCTRQINTRVINVVGHHASEDNFAELGFIIHPRKTKKRVSYLNDVVNQINASLLPLVRKSKDTGHLAKKPVEYNSGQKLYPFQLQEDALVPDYLQKLGEPAVSLWVLNYAELFYVAGENKAGIA